MGNVELTRQTKKPRYYRFILREEIEKDPEGFNLLLVVPDEPTIDGYVVCYPFKLVNGTFWMNQRLDLPLEYYVSSTKPINDRFALRNGLWMKSIDWLSRKGVYPQSRKHIHVGRVTL